MCTERGFLTLFDLECPAPGTRAQIQAKRDIGSAALHNGEWVTVIEPHPSVRGWALVELDGAKWPISLDRLKIPGSAGFVDSGPGLPSRIE
jgi:hypothetical protein